MCINEYIRWLIHTWSSVISSKTIFYIYIQDKGRCICLFVPVGKAPWAIHQHFSLKERWLTEKQSFYLLLRCAGALQGSPRNLLGFKGAVGGSLFTAISHGRIGDVVQTSHTLGKETVQWRHFMLPLIVLTLQKHTSWQIIIQRSSYTYFNLKLDTQSSH